MAGLVSSKDDLVAFRGIVANVRNVAHERGPVDGRRDAEAETGLRTRIDDLQVIVEGSLASSLRERSHARIHGLTPAARNRSIKSAT